MLPSQDTSRSPDDEKILKYTVELFHQLRITKPEPDAVAWDNDMRPDLVVVKFGEVRLPRSMNQLLAFSKASLRGYESTILFMPDYLLSKTRRE